jgi:hypothetical protein
MSSLFIRDQPIFKLLDTAEVESCARRSMPTRLQSEHAATEGVVVLLPLVLRDLDVVAATQRGVPTRLVVVGHNDLSVLAVLGMAHTADIEAAEDNDERDEL